MLSINQYFDEPFPVGFSVGSYELGLDPSFTPVDSSTLSCGGVTDITATHTHFLRQGATAHSPIADAGGGIRVAAVRDPLGNVVGLIENPHFKVKN